MKQSLSVLLDAIYEGTDAFDINTLSLQTVRFALISGLGPYLKYLTNNSNQPELQEFSSSLTSADLTAKLISASQIQALINIIKAMPEPPIEIILLKGISISLTHYPLPHLRTMGDIDYLVPIQDQSVIEEKLLEIGYVQKSYNTDDYYKSHHHSMPFYNKNNNIWMEVHTHIIPRDSFAKADPVFDIANIRENSQKLADSRFTQNIKYLTPELHFIYTCTHLAEDFKLYKGAVQITDIILLIKNNSRGLQWDKIFNWIDNTASASYVYMLLTFLRKNTCIAVPEFSKHTIKLKNNNMGLMNIYILHKIIDNYILGKKNPGRIINENILHIIWTILIRPNSSIANIIYLPWGLLFPPDKDNRFKIHLLAARFTNLFKRQ